MVRIFLIISILSLNICCDQVSKSIVRKNIEMYDHIKVVDHYFILTKVENTGAFLSLGQTFAKPVRFIVLLLLPIIVLVLALLYMVRQKDLSKITIIGLSFIIAGGASNLYDRVLHGSVTDFMHMDFGFFRTGIFNMADVSIMTGLFLILTEAIIKSYKLKKEKTEEPVSEQDA